MLDMPQINPGQALVPKPTNMPKRLSQSDVVAIVEGEIASAVGYTADKVVTQQTNALRRYFGEPYGNEVDGRSSVIDRTVMDTVEQAIPSLMRIFASVEKLARYEPVMPSLNQIGNPQAFQQMVRSRSDQADQATDYCNWLFFEENNGFIILHDWIKDALLQKLGIVKMWWDTSQEVRYESFQGLNPLQITKLVKVDLPGADIVEQRQTGEQPDQMTGMVMPVFDIKIKLTRRVGRISIVGVPPEEFMVSRGCRDINDRMTTFACHHSLMSRSDLINMGLDAATVQDLPAGSFRLSMQDTAQRARFNDETTYSNAIQNRSGQNALIETFDCFIRVDEDGDGIAELRRIFYAGHKILIDTEFARSPFYGLCPIRVPHKLFGLSYADMTMDLQEWKTALVRGINDNVYGSNAPELAIGPGVNVEDVLLRKPRGVIRADDVNQIKPIVIPFTAGECFPVLSYIDECARRRTGINSDMAALDPETLKRVTATGVSEMMTMARSRPELVARVFAETGIKQLFSDMLSLIRENQDYTRIIKLRGGYVAMDPRDWDTDMTCVCRVGMGYNSDQDLMGALNTVLALQEKIIMAGGGQGSVSPQNIYNTISKLLPLQGLPDITPYFNVPSGQSPPPPPDPRVQLEQQKAASSQQIEQQKAANEQQRSQHQMVMDMQAQQAELRREQQEFFLNVQKTQHDMAAQTAQMAAKFALMEKQSELKEREMLLRIDAESNRAGGPRTSKRIAQLLENAGKPRKLVKDEHGDIIGSVVDNG
jgi:hypothetical protein